MELFLIRHGQSEEHAAGLKQSPQSVLSPRGREEAGRLGGCFRKIDLAGFLSSPWPRAWETAEIIGDIIGTEPVGLLEAHEWLKPDDYYYTSNGSEFERDFLQTRELNWPDPGWKYQGQGESQAELLERAGRVREKLLVDFTGEPVALVSHGEFIRAFLVGAIFPLEKGKIVLSFFLRNFYTDNGGVTLLNYSREKKQWWLRGFNLSPLELNRREKTH